MTTTIASLVAKILADGARKRVALVPKLAVSLVPGANNHGRPTLSHSSVVLEVN